MSDTSSEFAIPSAGYSVTLDIQIPNVLGTFAELMTQVAELGGYVSEVELISSNFECIHRKITINCKNEAAAQEIIQHIQKSEIVTLISWQDDTFEAHIGGKFDIVSKSPLLNSDDLSRAYTPGVARVCTKINQSPKEAYDYTIKGNCVAVVSDGTAVLGLGDIGPEAAMPVMEGKAILLKEFAGVNGFPICLNTKDTDEIIETVKRIAPSFGGINLEDISAPRCFEIEQRLDEELDIPVFHDDQHGTAVVFLAGLVNAVKILGKELSDLKVVVNGFGAGGVACIKIMLEAGMKNIIACDTAGIAYRGRTEKMNPIKEEMVQITNPENLKGTVADAMKGADLFLGVSVPGAITREMVETMNPNPILFTLANPIPEIFPNEISDIAGIIATGRSDYPNQVNNVLCFPGLFRGALNCRATKVTMGMKLAAAYAIAESVDPEKLSKNFIIPSVFDRDVADRVAVAVEKKAREEGVAQA